MKKYTLETLKKENELFDSYYGLDESDVEKSKPHYRND